MEFVTTKRGRRNTTFWSKVGETGVGKQGICLLPVPSYHNWHYIDTFHESFPLFLMHITIVSG